MTETQIAKPDILDCLANLSSDEVFTPPSVVNAMLDMLPQELFANPKTKFLDPFTKSGVFLREIAKRLDKGLAKTIPDKEARIRHIFANQVYGIAITQLTAVFSRRSLYCNKDVNNARSTIRNVFRTDQGNIGYHPCKHTWKNGSCTICGASRKALSESADVENYGSWARIRTMSSCTLHFHVFKNMKMSFLSLGGLRDGLRPLLRPLSVCTRSTDFAFA